MADLIASYWVLFTIVAAIGAAPGFWIFFSRRHVDLPPVEIGQNTTQTLARTSRIAPVESQDTARPPLPFPVNIGPDVEPDDLLRLKGVGPKLARVLMDMGITNYCQIAAWSHDDVAAVDARLGIFSGRIVRDNWVEQARLLNARDVAGFEAKFGKLIGGML